MKKLKKINRRTDIAILLKEMGLNGFGIEIGVYKGDFSLHLLKTNLKKIYFVDPWKVYSENIYNDKLNCSQTEQDQRYNTTVDRLKIFGDRQIILRKDSIEALNDFNDNYFDLIYIDANHAYEYVLRDMINWYPKLKINGILSGHDYNIDSVKLVVDDFLKDNKSSIMIDNGSKRCAPSWYFIKQ